jgi:hypothetical protein
VRVHAATCLPLSVTKRQSLDDAVRILYFAATPGHPGLKIFYNVEGTTVTLLRGRPFDRFHEAGEI